MQTFKLMNRSQNLYNTSLSCNCEMSSIKKCLGLPGGTQLAEITLIGSAQRKASRSLCSQADL